MAFCDSCSRWFNSEHALTQHWINSPLHSYCRWCDDHFYDDDDLEEHYEHAHYWCRKCCLMFKNDYGLSEHYRQSSNHASEYHCSECNRDFASESNLRSHLNSSIHRKRTVPCRGTGCTMTFVSVAAMILHLESGNCVSGITRKYVDNKIREMDTRNVITNPSRLLTGAETVTYYASNSAWNGHAFECYLCHRDFKRLVDLNKHLASPRHQEKIYFCPLTTCRKQFTTLSALCQHIESEQCGVHKFREVRSAIDTIVGQVRMLTVSAY